MSKIAAAFKKQRKCFIPFITAGDPCLELTKQLIVAMANAGADIIELGIPFSDPVAEGEVIQAANVRALAAGTTTDKIFAMLAEVRKETDVPLVFLTYVNPIFTYGTEKFMATCQSSGVDGVIVPDVPFEEKAELAGLCAEYGVDLIPLVAPTSDERIKMIPKDAQGYVYIVSSLGVTGVRQNITTDIAAITAKIREVTDVPAAVGFGIATPQQAAQMAAVSDGAITGSAVVQIVGEHGQNCIQPVTDYVKQMAKAVHGVE